MKNNTNKFEIALQIAGMFAAINEQTREKYGKDKYNVHKFIGSVKLDKLSAEDLIMMEARMKKELLGELGVEHPLELLKKAFEVLFDGLEENASDDAETESNEDDADEDGWDCTDCPVSEICPKHQEAEDTEEDDSVTESNFEDEDEARAKEFVNIVKEMAKEQGFVLAELGLGILEK